MTPRRFHTWLRALAHGHDPAPLGADPDAVEFARRCSRGRAAGVCTCHGPSADISVRTTVVVALVTWSGHSSPSRLGGTDGSAARSAISGPVGLGVDVTYSYLNVRGRRLADPRNAPARAREHDDRPTPSSRRMDGPFAHCETPEELTTVLHALKTLQTHEASR
jgi:hypothetical protein